PGQEEIDVPEFIGVKGYKAKGRRISIHPVKKIAWLDPVPAGDVTPGPAEMIPVQETGITEEMEILGPENPRPEEMSAMEPLIQSESDEPSSITETETGQITEILKKEKPKERKRRKKTEQPGNETDDKPDKPGDEPGDAVQMELPL
ncbi:MAG: hypothetical protein WCI71_16500, partial [Bacteroidota bacterium]